MLNTTCVVVFHIMYVHLTPHALISVPCQSYPHNNIRACRALCTQMGWRGLLVGGGAGVTHLAWGCIQDDSHPLPKAAQRQSPHCQGAGQPSVLCLCVWLRLVVPFLVLFFRSPFLLPFFCVLGRKARTAGLGPHRTMPLLGRANPISSPLG